MSDSKEQAETKAELAKKFQDLINFSFDRLLDKSLALTVLRKVLGIKIQLDPEFMITQAGPFFFKYREKIKAEDIKFFLEHDYAEQIKDLSDLTAGYGENVALGLVEGIKTALGKTKAETVKKLVNGMLETYCKYVIQCRQQ